MQTQIVIAGLAVAVIIQSLLIWRMKRRAAQMVGMNAAVVKTEETKANLWRSRFFSTMATIKSKDSRLYEELVSRLIVSAVHQ